MSVNWDFYKRRHRVDLHDWKSQQNIVTYSDFLKALRSISVEPVPPTHPDLVTMGITGGDEARRILEESQAKKHGDPSSTFADARSKEIKPKTKRGKKRETPFGLSGSKESLKEKTPEPVAKKYKKSDLLKMKKSELQDLCKTLSATLSAGKQTKASIISDIMTHQSLS